MDVEKAMQLDFTWERREELIRKEEFAEGKAAGKAEGKVESLEALMKNMHWTLQEACKALGITEQEYYAAKRLKNTCNILEISM